MSRKRKSDELDPEMKPELDPELQPEQAAVEVPQEGAQKEEDEEMSVIAQEIEQMAAALKQKTQEAAEANEKYLRTYADFENYRKRVQRDQVDFRKYANEQLALELLTVVDHLGLAIRHANESSGGGEGLQQGVELVHKQFRDVLEKFGIMPFKAAGEPFDPALHEAMMQVETPDAPENTVVQVLQEGYRYHEKVLRHAKVGVAKQPAGGAPKAASEETTQAARHDDDDEED